MSVVRTRRGAVLAAAALVLLAASCGSKVTIHGKLTHNSAPTGNSAIDQAVSAESGCGGAVPDTIKVKSGTGELVGQAKMSFVPNSNPCVETYTVQVPKENFYEFLVGGEEHGKTFSNADLKSAGYSVTLNRP